LHFEQSALRENRIFVALFAYFFVIFVFGFFALAGVLHHKMFCVQEPFLSMFSVSFCFNERSGRSAKAESEQKIC